MVDASSPMSRGPPYTSEAMPQPTSGYAHAPERSAVSRTISLRSRLHSIRTHNTGGGTKQWSQNITR
jgi:hypothetical protein